MFTVLDGGKQAKINKRIARHDRIKSRYKELYYENKASNIQKAIFYGMKYLSHTLPSEKAPYDEIVDLFLQFDYVKTLMTLITFEEFVRMFPIVKDYDGERFCSKDYYSTKEYLSQFDMKEKITNADELCFNYYNYDVMNFGTFHILTLDRIRRCNGQLGVLESWLDEVDPEGKVSTYTLHEKEGYMQDNKTGKTFKIRKPKKRIPKYLKVVKKGDNE